MKNSRQFIFYMIVVLSLIITDGFSQLRLVHITDIHVSRTASLVGNCDVGGAIFSKMINHFRNMSPRPDAVVASGDISDVGEYDDGMYSELTQHLYPASLSNPDVGDYFIDSAQSIPIYFVAGNHDYYLVPGITGTSLNNYPAQVAPAEDYYIVRNNVVIAFIYSGYDAFRPMWEDWNVFNPEGSGITNEQCSFLRNVFHAHPDKKKIIVMHHPPVHALGTNADGSPSTGTIVDAADGSIIKNRQTLLNICDSFQVDVVLAGHVHQNVVADRMGNIVNENWTGGTRFVQTAACMYRCYRMITIDSSFVWIGAPQQLSFSDIADNVESNPLQLSFSYAAGSKTISLKRNTETTGNMMVSLYDLTGKKIFTGEFSAEHLDIDASDFAQGIYLIMAHHNKGIFRQKIAVY